MHAPPSLPTDRRGDFGSTPPFPSMTPTSAPIVDRSPAPPPRSSFRFVVLGGGEAGLTLLAELHQWNLASDVALVEPSAYHYSQRDWVRVGTESGIDKEQTRSEIQDRLPSSVTWIRAEATGIAPNEQHVILGNGTTIHYDHLIVALGTTPNWDRIRGLKKHLGTEGLCSVYGYEHSETTWTLIRSFGGGRALFTAPSPPHKGGIAPLTILQRAESLWRETGVLPHTELFFVTATSPTTAGASYRRMIEREAKEAHIHVYAGYDLVEVRPDRHEAVFVVDKGQSTSKAVLPYDLLHVVPPMRPPALLLESGLAIQDGPMRGYLEVHPDTLRHQKFDTIFGIGDTLGVDGVKTGARARSQAVDLAQTLRRSVQEE